MHPRRRHAVHHRRNRHDLRPLVRLETARLDADLTVAESAAPTEACRMGRLRI
jgi:hypothetical protein